MLKKYIKRFIRSRILKKSINYKSYFFSIKAVIKYNHFDENIKINVFDRNEI